MLNPDLDLLNDYPFDRLRGLLDPLDPPADKEKLLLSIGEPRHPAPPMVAEALERASGLWGKYPPVDATPAFRRAVADWLTNRYHLPGGMVDPDKNVLPICGSREALFLIGHLAVAREKNGKRPVVLVPNPYYHTYSATPLLTGAEAVFVPATKETGFLPDFASLDEDILERTALAYLCSPSNPQGAVADMETLKATIELARKYDFVLAADECYAEVYTETPPPGALQACAELGADGGGLMDNVVIFHSLSKRSSVPGLRSGFVAGPDEAMRLFRRLRSYSGATLPLPIVEASTTLWGDETHVAENRALYKAKFEAAARILGPRFGDVIPAGAFYLWLDVGDGEAAARKLWTEGAIRVLPGEYMARTDAQGHNPGAGYVRAALVHDLETTVEALQRIADIL